jgi:hypothetical protein
MQGGFEHITREKILDMLPRYHNAGYSTPKWLQFCSAMLEYGFTVHYYDAKTTVSKYVYVINEKNGEQVKVRFSNHKPNWRQEENNDSDFYVGISNKGVITTEKVIPQVLGRLRGAIA